MINIDTQRNVTSIRSGNPAQINATNSDSSLFIHGTDGNIDDLRDSQILCSSNVGECIVDLYSFKNATIKSQTTTNV